MIIKTEFSVGDTVFIHDWNMILNATVRQVSISVTKPSTLEEFEEVSITYQLIIDGLKHEQVYVERLLYRSKEEIIEELRKKYLS